MPKRTIVCLSKSTVSGHQKTSSGGLYGVNVTQEKTRLKDNHVKGLPSTTAEGPMDKDAQLTV